MEEVYISNKDTGIPEDCPTKGKQIEIVDKLSDVVEANTTTKNTIETANGLLEDIKVLVTLPQDLTVTASPTFVGETISGLTASRIVYTNGDKELVSGATNVTASELEELSDGSETTLHSHAAASAGNCNMKTGVYTGNSNDNREIDISVNLANKTYVYIVLKHSGVRPAVHRIEYSQGDLTMLYDTTSDTANYIQSLSTNGFVLGNSDIVNGAASTYRYMVFWVD